jgi:hypothetical protein
MDVCFKVSAYLNITCQRVQVSLGVPNYNLWMIGLWWIEFYNTGVGTRYMCEAEIVKHVNALHCYIVYVGFLSMYSFYFKTERAKAQQHVVVRYSNCLFRFSRHVSLKCKIELNTQQHVVSCVMCRHYLFILYFPPRASIKKASFSNTDRKKPL